MDELFMDRRVQLLLAKFLSGELKKITPVFDPKLGHRYPGLEPFIEDPGEADAFLLKLEGRGLLRRELCGVLVCCSKCGSCNLEEAPPIPGSDWMCGSCGGPIKGGEASFRRVYSFQFSEEGIERISDRLVLASVRDFLHKRGYRTISPGTLIGESEVEHIFDIVAHSVEPDEGVLVVDFVVSDSPAGEERVIAMFAKVFDTNPLRSILVAFPGLTENARKLSEQYGIAAVESGDVGSLFRKLLRAIPPSEEMRLATLDVMTLLSLPDHLRKTATVVCSLGRGTAEEIAERTSRARAVESGYMNQLVRMGYLKKGKRGREVLFSVAP